MNGFSQQMVKFDRGHFPLELGPADDRREQAIGVQQRLLPETQVVDPDDPGQA